MQGAAATPCPTAAAGGIHSARRCNVTPIYPRAPRGAPPRQANNTRAERRPPWGGPPRQRKPAVTRGAAGATDHARRDCNQRRGGRAEWHATIPLTIATPRMGGYGRQPWRGNEAAGGRVPPLLKRGDPMTAAAYAISSTPPTSSNLHSRGSSDHRPSTVASRREPHLATEGSQREGASAPPHPLHRFLPWIPQQPFIRI